MYLKNKKRHHLILIAAAVSLFLDAAVIRHCRAEAFPQPTNTEKSPGEPMRPEDVCRTAKLPPGFHLNVFASEPDVQNPISMTTDDRGRLWVAENYTWAGADAGNFDPKLRDRVVILEDTDGDGDHDKRTVFYDEAEHMTSIEVGFGGAWLLCPPKLLFVPDRNRDDVPDGPPEVILDGFDIESVSHTVANGLKWGPDGWLYGRHGILGTSKIGQPAAKDADRVEINTGVWRVHPTRKVCEAVMHGMTNPWGCDYDPYGEMFVINTVIGHLWHVIPGGRTERMFGADFNPHAYQLLPQTADHVHWDASESWTDVHAGVTDRTSAAGGGHAHTGLMIYQGDNWPPEYRGNVYTLNLHGRRLNRDILVDKSVGYSAKHGHDLCFIADPFFRGMDVINSADGSVFIADWSDTGECHEIGGVHRLSGRIYRLAFEKAQSERKDLARLSDVELAGLQTHTNDWWTRHARRLLQERASSGSLDKEATRIALTRIFKSQIDPVHRCRAMWALYLTDCADESWLVEQLSNSNEHVRAWAVRFLVDKQFWNNPTTLASIVPAFRSAAERDRSGLVLIYIASALQKLPPDARWAIAQKLAARTESKFTEDRTLSIVLWLGIEPLIPTDPAKAIALARETRFQLLRENIAHRLGLEIDTDLASIEQLLTFAASDKAAANPILRGISLSLTGRKSAPAPNNWADVSHQLIEQDDDATRDHVNEIGIVIHDPATLNSLHELVSNASESPAPRVRALELLVSGEPGKLLPLLRQLLHDKDLAASAIRGLAQYDDDAAADDIINLMPAMPPNVKSTAVTTLASRPSYAKKLIEALQSKKLLASDVSAYQVRQLHALNDSEISDRLRDLWGDVHDTPADKRALIAKLKRLVANDNHPPASADQGKVVFQKTCSTCHTLFGEGKRLAPDITGSNRKNLDYLLQNVVDPSAVVGADFRMKTYVLVDGRLINGVTAAKTDRTTTVNTPEGAISLDNQNIEEVDSSDRSMMPDGLLQTLTDSQIRDLFAYLMSQ